MSSKNYKDYSLHDFMEDDDFQKWSLEDDQEQHNFWQQFAVKNPLQYEKAKKAKSLLQTMHVSFREGEEKATIKDLTFEQQLKNINQPTNISSITPKQNNTRKSLLTLLAAACLLMAISMFTYLFIAGNKTIKPIEYATVHGEWQTIQLPDGSNVELNANSKLTLLDKWIKGEERKVWLEGEGFFKVTKKESPTAKFLVMTRDLTIEVYGTQFNVNTRNSATEIYLEEGKVSVVAGDEHTEMLPGELIKFDKRTNTLVKEVKLTNTLSSPWKEGVLRIQDATLSTVIKELETIYGVEFVLENEALLSLKGNGVVSLPVDDLFVVTKILNKVFNISASIQNEQVIINKGK